jgi:hypothetical protein
VDIARLKEAATRANSISAPNDDLYVGIEVRPYGFLVHGRMEIDGRIRHNTRQVGWLEVEQAIANPLLIAIDTVIEVLRKSPAST